MTATLARAVGLNTPHRTGPWSQAQFAAVVAGNLVAVAFSFVGWLRTSSEGHAGDQIPWLNVSFAGVVVALAVNGLFLARGRQSLRMAIPVALTGVGRSGADLAPAWSSNGHGPTRSGRATLPGRVVAVAGLKRYHRPDCALVAGKVVEDALPELFLGAGLVRCEVCEP